MSYGYGIGRDEGGYQLTHPLYIDDLKLYASSRKKLQSVLDITLQFSNGISIEFELENCQGVHLVSGDKFISKEIFFEYVLKN